nr:MAG: capsid protein [Smacoviridae sp.]
MESTEQGMDVTDTTDPVEGIEMVTVRVSETYDLSTKVGKMGIVGIHTPDSDLITRMYAGLIQNFKFAQFVSCDVAMACASMLPADPLQIGMTAGDIAPQDMFNPILYKAVSNDSMNNILSVLETYESTNPPSTTLIKGSIAEINNPDFKNSDNQSVDQFHIYYALLSDSDGWRKAMPQAGLEMRGLYPLVFRVNSNIGFQNTTETMVDGGVPGLNLQDGSVGVIPQHFIRGPAARMPRFPTTNFALVNSDNNPDVFLTGDAPVVSNLREGLKAYVGLIVLPPAKLNQLYYRLKITWTIEFTECRSMTDILNWRSLANLGDVAYGTDYSIQSQSMAVKEGMADTSGAEITKIMEGAS